jgi:hypothetical protein
MKSFTVLKFSIILVGLGAALVLSPACKAQEVSPDHFTDTGVQDVYDGTQNKSGAPRLKQKPPTTQARTHQVNSAATLQPVARRTPASAAQPNPKAVADKRKTTPSTSKKP